MPAAAAAAAARRPPPAARRPPPDDVEQPARAAAGEDHARRAPQRVVVRRPLRMPIARHQCSASRGSASASRQLRFRCSLDGEAGEGLRGREVLAGERARAVRQHPAGEVVGDEHHLARGDLQASIPERLPRAAETRAG